MKRLSVARHSAFWFSAGKSPVTLDDLCKVTGISKYHLIRLFQKHVGTTPGQYLRDQRLQLAEQLLRHSQKNILSIALESGFNSLSSFERAFGKKSLESVRPGIAKGYLLKVGLPPVLVTPEASPVTAKNRIITDETSNKPKEVCKEPISATRPISTGPTIKDKYPAPVTMETERAPRPGMAREASENETGATGERANPTPSNPQAATTGLDVSMTTAIPTEAMSPLKIKIRLSPAFSIKAELLKRPIIAEKCKDAMPIPPNRGPD